MVGNVWEWVADAYAPYPADAADTADPRGPDLPNGDRVLRGGAWNGASADWIRPTARHRSPPDTRSHGVGFRCAL
jgi:formylglycine-generating enzyme required for sulfatase activity